jgi:hypothetical protein
MMISNSKTKFDDLDTDGRQWILALPKMCARVAAGGETDARLPVLDIKKTRPFATLQSNPVIVPQ